MNDAVALGPSDSTVDAENRRFYDRYPYPWPAASFTCLSDPYLASALLAQDLGDWSRSTLPTHANVWVAGCGTNQAIGIALNFPEARIMATDLSEQALGVCRTTADNLGLTNLALALENINDATHVEEFDYIVCTGVIHHLERPDRALAHLRAALKRNGVLELMVYNRFHRIGAAAFQKAIRMLAPGPADSDAPITSLKQLMGGLPSHSPLLAWLSNYHGAHDSLLADTFLQPVESSFTVAELDELARRCALRLLAPRPNMLDRAEGTQSWNMEFSDERLQESYDARPAIERWQISNLMLQKMSPHLWFFLRRDDSTSTTMDDYGITDTFLDRAFVRSASQTRVLTRDSNGTYRTRSGAGRTQHAPLDTSLREVVGCSDGTRPMRDILRALNLLSSRRAVNEIRLATASSTSPFLLAAEAP